MEILEEFRTQHKFDLLANYSSSGQPQRHGDETDWIIKEEKKA